MFAISRPVSEDLRPEVPHVQTEHSALPHGSIPARRGPHPAFTADVDATDLCQPPAKVGVLAVKLDRAIEAVDSRQRLAPDREVAAVEYGANLKRVVHEEVGWRRDEHVIRTEQRTPASVPVVEPVRPRRADQRVRS